MNFVNFGGHLINLDQIVDIQTEAERPNHDVKDRHYMSVMESCVVFVRPVASGGDMGFAPDEICFFSPQREVVLEWLLSKKLDAIPMWQVPLPPKRVYRAYEDKVEAPLEVPLLLEPEDIPF